MAKRKTVKKSNDHKERKKYLSQSDVPGCLLEQALRIPRAITDNYAGRPVTPLQLASAISIAPTSGGFRQLCGASIAYGLTEGGYNAKEICMQPLGKRIVKPLKEGDDLIAKREAILRPRVLGEFLKKYSGSSLPRHDIAMNVLETMGVPSDKTKSVYSLIIDSAQSVGLLREFKNKQFVDLAGVNIVKEDESEDKATDELKNEQSEEEIANKETDSMSATSTTTTQTNRRVFITHGKNKTFIDPIKKLLGFGELIPVVSVEKQSVSQPVSDKVMNDMRKCGAAIIHVEDEQHLVDKDAKEYIVLNSNVLIEIGAAIALYGRRFILLVKEGVKLPSNLQGLYEVRYSGDSLGGNDTIRLLEAINEMKKEKPLT